MPAFTSARLTVRRDEAVGERERAARSPRSRRAVTRGRASSTRRRGGGVVDLDQQRRLAASRRSRRRRPAGSTRPWSTIATWSHVFSTSSSRCDERKTVRPSPTNARIRRRISRMPGRVEPVHRLVEDQERRVGEQAPGDAEALPHAERVRLHAVVRALGQPHALERVGDAPVGGAISCRGDDLQVLAAGRCGWNFGSSTIAPTRASASRRFAGWARPRSATSPDVALRQTEQRPDHGRLAGAVGAEEAEGDAGGNDQVDAVDGRAVAEPLRQRLGLDDGVHGRTVRQAESDERQVRRREQVADPLRAAAAGHLERRAEAVHRHEAELPRRLRVAAAGDQHRPEPMRGRVAGAPLDERLQRVAGAARRGTRRAPARRRPPPARRLASRSMSRAVRGSKKSARYGVCVGRGKRRGNGCTRIAVPPGASGGVLRHSRSARPEAEVRGADGVRAFARHERRRRRDADHDRVERLVELDALEERCRAAAPPRARPTACRRTPPRRSAREAAVRARAGASGRARAGRARRTRERSIRSIASWSYG